MTDVAHKVLQMRLVVEAEDYEEAVRFYEMFLVPVRSCRSTATTERR
jgi:hypothetical protein